MPSTTEAGPQIPLAVCVLPTPAANIPRVAAYPAYIQEILSHAGVCFTLVNPEDLLNALPRTGILLTVGEGLLPADAQASLRPWVEAGGAWIAVAGTLGLVEMLGVALDPPAYSSWGGGPGTLGEGYLDASASSYAPAEMQSSILSHPGHPLRFFNGVPVRANGCAILASVLDAHQRPTGRAAVAHHHVGEGETLLIAPDLTGTIVRIQQGIAVTRDGIPAPDGTAPISDGVLKSGDGGVLDWIFDRHPVEGVPGYHAFLDPAADLWRDLLLRSLFFVARRRRVPLSLLWLYPRDLPGVAHLSHDTDGNDPAAGRLLLEALQAREVRSTWCVILPGYPPELIEEIRRAGHELAMHYDTMTDVADWNEAAFDDQWRRVTGLLGRAPVSNKNHYLRWEGDTEFFDWCVRRGIRLDQSKGASKTGEAGFNFGTCHPYFPVAPDGRVIDVLELATPTQDLVVFAPEPLLDGLLASVRRTHGILHLLFHPAHIGKPGVALALDNAITKAQKSGMEWWTAEAIDAWERARRRVVWERVETQDDTVTVSLTVPRDLHDARLLILADHETRASVNGTASEARMVERWGFSFQSVSLDSPPASLAADEGDRPTVDDIRSVTAEWNYD